MLINLQSINNKTTIETVVATTAQTEITNTATTTSEKEQTTESVATTPTQAKTTVITKTATVAVDGSKKNNLNIENVSVTDSKTSAGPTVTKEVNTKSEKVEIDKNLKEEIIQQNQGQQTKIDISEKNINEGNKKILTDTTPPVSIKPATSKNILEKKSEHKDVTTSIKYNNNNNIQKTLQQNVNNEELNVEKSKDETDRSVVIETQQQAIEKTVNEKETTTLSSTSSSSLVESAQIPVTTNATKTETVTVTGKDTASDINEATTQETTNTVTPKDPSAPLIKYNAG